MSATNRAKLIGKLQTALKKHYKPVSVSSRPLLEHILFASLLQDATYEMAEEGIAKCEQDFYDWNEVRVTTVTELSQVLSNLPDPLKAAARLKGNLLEIFEEFFSFDIDHLKKDNLGKAVAKFEKMSQMTPFVLSYAVQNGLGGHSIPIDYAAMVVMLSTGIVDQSEAAEGRVPGLERAIPKTKAVEFSSLLHQCGVALLLDPTDKTARRVLDATEKGAADRMDQFLSDKAAAKKRVKKRKTSERAAAQKAEAEEAANPTETAAVKGKSKSKTAGRSKPSGPAKPKTAPPIEKTETPAKASKSASAEDAGVKSGGARSAKKPKGSRETAGKAESATVKKSAAKKSPEPKSSAGKSSAAKSSEAKSAGSATKKTAKKTTEAKSPAAKSPAAKSPGAKSPAAKSGAVKPKGSAAAKKSPKKAAAKKAAAKSDSRRLTKKKPR